MKKKVLLVDDDSVAHFINKRLLEKSQLTEHIATTNNGVEAIQYIQRTQKTTHTPDIIFLDIDMPIMNGFTFIETLNAIPELSMPPIPVILLSSSYNDRDKAKAVSMGINFFLQKPLSHGAILQVFSSVFQ